MGLASGTKLGPYEIAAPLGAGGMGEVYRARDTRLDRTVAVKILPSHLSSHPDARQRFEREARVISSLSHPNICHLYDVGCQDGVDFLVMEFLEGETLADRLRKGPLATEHLLRYALEICEGLEKAHKSGVIHRDLKPGNIMLTKAGAKLMDFGLAKALQEVRPPSSGLTVTIASSKADQPLTAQGAVVGTFQYISPEQLEGKDADQRSDIFALGAVLYEMATGKRAFEGRTTASVIAAVLERDPAPISAAQPASPPALDRVVKTCIAKDPEERFQSVHDLKLQLKWMGDGVASGSYAAPYLPGVRGVRASRWLPWLIAALAMIAVVVLGIMLSGSAGNKPLIRTQIAPSEKLQFNFVNDTGGPPEISPDGTRIVFSARSGGKTQLFLRSMSQSTPQVLPGTEDAIFPFWSADGREVGFFQAGKLKRFEIAGGAVLTVCDAPVGRGGSWSSDGTILFSPQFSAPIFQVPASGGAPAPVTKFSGQYTSHRWPFFLPDGKHFLYLATSHTEISDTAVYWASLDGKDSKMLLSSPSQAMYASGYLLYVREGSFMAQRFDPSSGTFKGEAVVLNDKVQVDSTIWRGTFTVSSQGTLVYQPGGAGSNLRLTWFDRDGKELGNVGEPDAYLQADLSPDDKKAAVTIGDPMGVIWIYDLVHNSRTRFSYGTKAFSNAVWSKDGKQLAYLTGEVSNAYSRDIEVKASDGSGEARKRLSLSGQSLQEGIDDWSPDGRYLLYDIGTMGRDTGVDIWVLPMFGDRKPFAYIASAGDQGFGQFSPDGKWIAYMANETGRMEVYVAPFPWTGAKWLVSSNGGTLPRWGRDGKEIYFEVPGSGRVMEALVNPHGTTIELGEVRMLFEANNFSPNTAASQWAMASDGKRLLNITTGDKGVLPLTVIQNWTTELRK